MMMTKESIPSRETANNLSLNNINLVIRPGEFIGVTGPVGSGKSTLLQALLEEVPKIKGKMRCSAKLIAYASQTPFIFNDTLKANILFFREFNEDLYIKAIEICNLAEDISSMPLGDSTIVGDSGGKLSVGQKQRIALARCFYSNAEIYLLDNCLTSLDQYVANNIFIKLKNELKSKTVLFVTQNTEFLAHSSRIITMNVGEIIEDKLNSQAPEKIRVEIVPSASKTNFSSLLHTQKAVQKPSISNNNGSVPFSIYKKYFGAKGLWPVVTILFIFSSSQAFKVLNDWWLGVWSEGKFEISLETTLIIYLTITIISGIFLFLRSAIFFKVTLGIAQKINEKLLKVLLNTRLQWFDSTPIGQILARMIKDQDNLDNTLPSTVLFNLTQVFMLICVIITGGLANAWYLLMAFFVGVIYTWMVVHYIRSAREAKRIELEGKAPILNIISETVGGLAVIRAFDRSDDFLQKFNNTCDKLSTAMQNFLFCGNFFL
jgi:ABC-type bacteriocin/lantibiotic exporter with double-glycine peptidase domain